MADLYEHATNLCQTSVLRLALSLPDRENTGKNCIRADLVAENALSIKYLCFISDASGTLRQGSFDNFLTPEPGKNGSVGR